MGLPQPPGQPEKAATITSDDAQLGKPVNIFKNDVGERPTMKSEPITQEEYLEDDVINRTASLAADDAENENGGLEFQSVSPAVEVEGNPGKLCSRYPMAWYGSRYSQ